MKKLIVTLLVFLVVVGCASKEETVKQPAQPVSSEEAVDLRGLELAYGKAAHERVVAFFGVDEHIVLRGYVQRIGEQLALYSDRNDLTYRFTVLDTSQIRVFSLPGGYVYISRGLLVLLNNDAQLAAVLAHELAHITAGHVNVAVGESLPRVSRVGNEFAYFAPQRNFGGVFADIAEISRHGYGKDNELAAARLAAIYMARANYDPAAMLDIYSLMSRETKAGHLLHMGDIHGALAGGEGYREELVKIVNDLPWKKSGGGDLIRTKESYVTRLAGVQINERAIVQWRGGGRFSHPVLAVAGKAPSDWRVSATPTGIFVYPKEQGAYLKISLTDQAESNDASAALKALHSGSDLTNMTVVRDGAAAWFIQDRQSIYGDGVALFGVTRLANGAIYAIEACAGKGAAWEANYPKFRQIMKALGVTAGGQQLNLVQAKEVAVLPVAKLSKLEDLLSRNKDYANADQRWIRYLNQMAEHEPVLPGQYIKVTK